jgi:hypothetical protein
MKISATTNAALWGALAIIALAGIPATILRPGFLGPIPMFGSLLAGVILSKLAYSQWREQKVTVDFWKAFPMLTAGAALTYLLSTLARAPT